MRWGSTASVAVRLKDDGFFSLVDRDSLFEFGCRVVRRQELASFEQLAAEREIEARQAGRNEAQQAEEGEKRARNRAPIECFFSFSEERMKLFQRPRPQTKKVQLPLSPLHNTTQLRSASLFLTQSWMRYLPF